MCFVFVGWWLESHVFFLEEGASSPRSMGAPSLMSFFLGGTSKIVGKSGISGKSFWGKAPKIVGKSRISGEIFLGKDHQDSGKSWDLLRNFFGEGPPR